MSAEEFIPIVNSYLRSKRAEQVPLGQWEKYYGGDGSNSIGWRVFVDDWGHVGINGDKHNWYHGAVCAIKRVNLWYGK